MVAIVRSWWLAYIALVPHPAGAVDAASLAALEAYGNFTTAGVVVTIAGDDNRNAAVALESRRSGQAAFASAHPLVRIDDIHFVGSLFWLTPGTPYDVRVTLSDPGGTMGGTTAATSFATRVDALAEPGLRTLYVSPAGSDNAAGTSPATTLATIQEAASRSLPGDLILVSPGIYREPVLVTHSGTETQPIVFRATGPGVILDGADATIAAGVSWLDQGDGLYSFDIGSPTGHVVSDQGRLYQYSSVAELEALAAGAPGGFHYDGLATLYVRFSDGSHPSQRTIDVARHDIGFYLSSVAWVRVEGFEIRHYGSENSGKGVYLRFTTDCAVRGNNIHEVGFTGVSFKGGERNLIEDNEIWDTSIFGWPWQLTKGSSAENKAVRFTDAIGRGNVVRRNLVHGLFNGIVPCGVAAPPEGGITSETDIYDNELWELTDDAFEPEGYCSNIRLWGNRIRDSHMAFAVAPAQVGPVFVLRNQVTGIGNTRSSLLDGQTSTSALKIHSSYLEPVGPLFLYHNTFYTETPSTNVLYLGSSGQSTFITARNNAFVGTRWALDKKSPVTLDFDWDLLYSTDPEMFIRWHGTELATLAELRSATGQELDGLAAPPGFVNPSAGDLMPLATSPLVDRGVAIPGINDGYAGAAPDIGAVERSELLFADGFESGDAAAWH